MWAKADLTPDMLEGTTAEEVFGSQGLWLLLLFQEADANVAKALSANWGLMHGQLGKRAHLVTLLDRVGGTDDQPELAFPRGYEAAVGSFCRALNVRSDGMPCVVGLNVFDRRDGRTIPYVWSLSARTLQDASRNFVRFVSDVMDATSAPIPGDPENYQIWLDAAARQASRSDAIKQLFDVGVREVPAIRALIKELFRRLGGG